MEQLIVFVYDTGFCQTEADDPQKAVLFFHPHWVSDQQRLALCGQLMGAAHFCSSMFSAPRVLTLQCGKFILKKFGRYILSVGSDQTLQGWILQERFSTLELLIQFYHNSFDSIFYESDNDQELFSKKLTDILEVYIPILQYAVCSLGNIFVLKCPKRSSSAFLEAFQFLEACCSQKGVIGGLILHNSRVIATQLDPDISKILVLTDKFHIRTKAEQIKTPFHLPAGVQLIKIYIKQKIYDNLCNDNSTKNSSLNGIVKKSLPKNLLKKKEISKIFTVQEEEDSNYCEPKPPDSTLSGRESMRNKSRKSKAKLENLSLKERSKSFVGGSNIKVCSTPTVEKTLIHEELVSICSSTVNIPSKLEGEKPKNDFIPDLVQDAIKAKCRTKYLNNRMNRVSMDDLMIDFTQSSYPVPLRYYSSGQPLVCREVKSSAEEKKKHRKFYKTIADPMNPVFRHDGLPVSKSLYNNCLSDHYKNFMAANLAIDSREEFLKNKHLEQESNKAINLRNNTKVITENSPVIEKENFNGEVLGEVIRRDSVEITKVNKKKCRRSLSLPLKPLTCESTEIETQSNVVKNKVLMKKTPTTPLTTKLSLLTFEENVGNETKPASTPSESSQLKPLIKNQNLRNDSSDREPGETISACLLVCGHQNMTALLVLDEKFEKNQDLILSLYEMSSNKLQKIENLRNKSIANMSNSENNNSSYSFLSMDSNWGTVQRSGPWGDDEFKIVGSLHNDLVKAPKITEIIVRNEDSVVYGYSCGGSKIFYQQGGCSSAGLPTPADLMGVVTLKARRRLERDKNVILL